MTDAQASPTLARRILSETTRFATLQALAAVLAWGVNVIVARLLEKRDFGLYGICSFYIGIGALLGDGGLGATLLRRKGDVTHDEYQATLTTLLVVSIALAIALYFGAPWIVVHNHLRTGDVRVVRAMAPLYLLGALRVVPYIRLERDLQFARIARIELASSFARHVLAIVLAFAHQGVWALVLANIVSASAQLALAYRAAPGWVGFGWSWRVFRPLIAYGGQVQALNFCSYLKDNVSRALLGTAVGPSAVGVFDFGLMYIQVPAAAVNSLARVQLPVYARLAASDPTLYRSLRGALRTALVFGIPALCALALASPWILPTIYDRKWLAAQPVIWGLVANMAGGLVASPLFTLLQGQGRAGLAVAVFLGWTACTWALAIASLVAFPGDLGMIALAHSVVTVGVVVLLTAWAARHLKQGLFSGLIGPVIAGCVALGLALVVGHARLAVVSHPVAIAVECVVFYFGLLFVMERKVLVEEFQTVVASVRRRPAGTRDAPDNAAASSE